MKLKLAHSVVGFKEATGKDRCGICKSFVKKNVCLKVKPPIDEDDWCKVGHSKIDGHAFYSEAR